MFIRGQQGRSPTVDNDFVGSDTKLPGPHERTQQARKRTHMKKQACWQLDVRPVGSRTMSNKWQLSRLPRLLCFVTALKPGQT